MSVLNQIKEMKDQGVPEEEMIGKLQEQKIPPKKINDALSQSKIKDAISNGEQMQPSIMDAPPTPSKQKTKEEDIYVPKTQETQEEAYAPQQQEYLPQQQEYQEYYPQQGYENYEAMSTGTDTTIEIAEQVFSEKIKKIQKKLDELNEFKTLAQVKINSTAERLKRIETIIDNLQISILDKVGSYGKNLDNVKKEMAMMQDTFKKTKKHSPVKHTVKKKSKKTSKK